MIIGIIKGAAIAVGAAVAIYKFVKAVRKKMKDADDAGISENTGTPIGFVKDFAWASKEVVFDIFNRVSHFIMVEHRLWIESLAVILVLLERTYSVFRQRAKWKEAEFDKSFAKEFGRRPEEPESPDLTETIKEDLMRGEAR